jgi:hypothetical protein
MQTQPYLPFDPMPRTKTALMKAMSDHIVGLPYAENFDDKRLRWVFQFHPWRKEKLKGRRIVSFSKRPCRTSYVIILRRDDGTEIDFSYRKCIDAYHAMKRGKPLSDDYSSKADLMQAMRLAIQDQIYAWGEAHRDQKKPGDVIDHVYPATFSHLADLFLRMVQARLEYGDDWKTHLEHVLPAKIRIKDGGADAFYNAVFDDPDLEKAWRSFHAENAVLRWLPESLNARFKDRKPDVDGLPAGSPLRDVVHTDRGWWSLTMCGAAY